MFIVSKGLSVKPHDSMKEHIQLILHTPPGRTDTLCMYFQIPGFLTVYMDLKQFTSLNYLTRFSVFPP